MVMYIYTSTNGTTYTLIPQGAITTSSGKYFGSNFSLSSDGNILGVRSMDNNYIYNITYLYQRNGTTFTNIYTANSNNVSDYSRSISLSGDGKSIVVGDIVNISGLQNNTGSISLYNINSTPNIYTGIGTTNPGYTLHVNGSIYATGDIIGLSDIREKKDIETITDALNKVKKMRGVYFTMRETDKKSLGLIAQETQQIIPEVVTSDVCGNHIGISYGNIVGLLVEAIKEANVEVDGFKTEVDELKKQNINLITQNDALEKRLTLLENAILGK
jgi:hypothetical protein